MPKHFIVILICGLAGCSPTPQVNEEIRSSPILATLPASRSGDSAALLARLNIKDSCIYALTSTHEYYLIANMNPGIQWNFTEQVLLLPNGQHIKAGESIILGGSSFNGKLASQLAWVTPPHQQCDLSHIWITQRVGKLTD